MQNTRTHMHDKLKYKQSDLEDDLYTVIRDDNRSKTYPPHNEINACEKSRLAAATFSTVLKQWGVQPQR